MSDSLWPQGLQHARPPCPSTTPGVHPNPCPQSWWCHPTISSSVVPFSSCPQSFPASGSFPVSQFFTSGDQSIGASASASSEYPGLISFRIDWLDLQGTFKVFSNTTVQKHQFFGAQLSLWSNSHIHALPVVKTTGETIALTRWTFVGKVMSLLFNMLSRLIIAFLPRSKHLLIE